MRYKYPRTYHLPFSPGFTSDDKVLKDDSSFRGKEIVVRLACSFTYDEFSKSIAKYVRPNHVQTDKHWSNSEIVKNGLKEKIETNKNGATIL